MNYIEDQPPAQIPRMGELPEVDEEFIGPAYPRHLPDHEQPHMIAQAEQIREFREDLRRQRAATRRLPPRQRRLPVRKSVVKKSARKPVKRVAKARVVTVTTKVPMDKTTKTLRKGKRLTILKKSKKTMPRRSYARRPRMSRGARSDYRNRIRYPVREFGRIYARRGGELTTGMFGPSAALANANQMENRRDYGYTGRGLYEGGGLYTGRGGFLSDLGGKAGAWLGEQGGKALGTMGEKYLGIGEYTKNSLVLGSTGVSADVPQFQSTPDETGALQITHREYVCDIFGNEASAPFKNRSFALNPGLEAVFPWLSQIAANYEEYDMKQLMFTFRSTTAIDVNANGQVGTTIMCTNYNASQGPFTEKNTMMQYDGAMSSKTVESQIHGVECDPAKLSSSRGKYVRTNPVLFGEDLKTYDHGIFQLATVGLPAAYQNQSIGELWVSYTVVLRKPKFFTGLGLSISRDLFVDNGPITNRPFINTNAGYTRGQQNNIGCIITDVGVAAGQFKVTFPASWAGTVEIIIIAETSSATAIETSIPIGGLLGNIVPVNDIYGGGSTSADSPSSSISSAFTANNLRHVYMTHLAVSIATGGVDNSVIFATTGAAFFNQASLDIHEYNSYARQGLPPVLINASGIVTVPV